MTTITYSEVHKLVMRLPANKLPVAFDLIADLSEDDTESDLAQQDFMRLSSEKRRQLMMEQATQLKSYYDQTTAERQAWQAGDFVEY
jgi:hypothetical protein